ASSPESFDGLWFVCHESFSFRVKLIFGPAPEAEDRVNETKGNDDLKSPRDRRPRIKARGMTANSDGMNLARGPLEQAVVERTGKRICIPTAVAAKRTGRNLIGQS